MSLSVCIFAHNEERRLPTCIGALDAAAAGADYHAHILVNGATDHTLETARSLASADPRIIVHNLPVADKAGAWNDYVYRIANDAAVHIFLDGDVRPSANAFVELARALDAAPRAYAAAALPATGRSRRAWASTLFLNNYLSGNLYALKGAALAAFRARALRLPFGAKGEDGIITYLLRTNLEGGEDDSHTNRIAIANGASFEFDSLSLNASDMKTYHRRLVRYSERHFQKDVLYRLLKQCGASAMPDNIADIYTPEALQGLRPRLDPVNYWYDRATLRRLKAQSRRSMERFA